MNTTSDLISYFDDALLDVPAGRRSEIRDYVVRRAAASALPPTCAALDELIAEGLRHLGIPASPQS